MVSPLSISLTLLLIGVALWVVEFHNLSFMNLSKMFIGTAFLFGLIVAVIISILLFKIKLVRSYTLFEFIMIVISIAVLIVPALHYVR